MKKILVSILVAVLSIPFVWAVPADSTPFRYVQPDGTVIVLQKHGDEYFHWTTDASGQVVEKNADGFYRPASVNFQTMAARAEELRAQNRVWSSYDNPPETNFGDRKVLCIIANFTDSTFVVDNPQQHFYNMLNQPGYSFNGATGSVRDYFVDNSRNQYRPVFDVFGPVNLAYSSSYYDQNGVDLAILEAYGMLHEQINIDDYDTDNDGDIDMVLFYYPGHNEAEDGGTESIWPHQRSGYFGQMGGKVFNRYFCTSELRNGPGQVPASIGTTCHEFSHSLGLPDFYDTDYGTNGYNSMTTGQYDLMSAGNYNNNGRTPPHLSAVERNMLGWMAYPGTISSSGDFDLPAVQNNLAYQFSTDVDGEYFVLESRNGYKWDSTLAPGLLIYHVDKSDRKISGNQTAAYLWENTNMINAYGGHPCYFLEPSAGGRYVFPGSGNVTNFIAEDLNGDQVGMRLSGIAYDGTQSSFTVTLTATRTVFGVVKDTSGQPIQGVEVSLTPSDAPFAAAPTLLPTSVTCTTNAAGEYSFGLLNSASEYQILVARKEGYTPHCVNLTISSLYTEQNLTMLRLGEGVPADLRKYDSSLSTINCGLGSGNIAVGMHYTAEELSANGYVGATLGQISFMANAQYTEVENGEKIYVVIRIGTDVYSTDVTSSYSDGTWMTVDVSSANFTIPAGKDLFIGYGIQNIQTPYPFTGHGYVDVDNGGCSALIDFLGDAFIVTPTFGGGYVGFLVSATLRMPAEVTFSTLGVSYIKLNGNTPEVVVAAGKSLKSTVWYLDGEPMDPLPVTSLPSGTHVYKVVLNYYDGTSERVFYEVVRP